MAEIIRLKEATSPRIAITGKMRAGKSTISDHIRFTHGFKKVAFADGIKHVADRYFSHMYEPVYRECPFDGEKEIAYYRKPRQLLQQIGQHMRSIDENIWIRQASIMVEFYEQYREGRGVVIDDLRQPNEEAWARANGFTIIRVNANEDERIERMRRAGDKFDDNDLRHETELYVDDIKADFDIWNGDDMAIEAVHAEIDGIMGEIKAKGGR